MTVRIEQLGEGKKARNEGTPVSGVVRPASGPGGKRRSGQTHKSMTNRAAASRACWHMAARPLKRKHERRHRHKRRSKPTPLRLV